jgi:hypothetical protein
MYTPEKLILNSLLLSFEGFTALCAYARKWAYEMMYLIPHGDPEIFQLAERLHKVARETCKKAEETADVLKDFSSYLGGKQ